MSTVATSPERLRDDLVRLVHRGADVRGFSIGAARILARAVPFDGVCVLTMDPATLLPTGAVLENGPPEAAHARLKELEFRGEDFIAFRSLAVSERHAATLSQATGGVLDRSERHRDIMGPHGFGDELRAALVDGEATTGALSLLAAIGSRAVLARPRRAGGSGDATARRRPAAGGAARPRRDRAAGRRGRCRRRRARPGRLDRVHGRGRRGLDR